MIFLVGVEWVMVDATRPAMNRRAAAMSEQRQVKQTGSIQGMAEAHKDRPLAEAGTIGRELVSSASQVTRISGGERSLI